MPGVPVAWQSLNGAAIWSILLKDFGYRLPRECFGLTDPGTLSRLGGSGDGVGSVVSDPASGVVESTELTLAQMEVELPELKFANQALEAS